MKMPGAERAVVDVAEVREYLLSPTHAVGRFKAVFFASLGYRQENWSEMVRDLISIALLDGARPTTLTRYGQKCEVRVMLGVPSGRRAVVVTVWIALGNKDFPRFVTAYPG